MVRAGFAAGQSVSRQPAGLTEFQYCLRLQRDSGNTGTGDINIFQPFESANSIPFAGKTVTLSFYARAGANYSAPGSVLISTIHRGTGIDQGGTIMSYGWTGGVGTTQSNTITTSWARYTQTLSLPSNTTQLGVAFSSGVLSGTAGAADFVEITGVQFEAGTVATPFRRNAPSIQAELAACQRYFVRYSAPQQFGTRLGMGFQETTDRAAILVPLPTTLRAIPTSMALNSMQFTDSVSFGAAITSANISTYGFTDKVIKMQVYFSAAGAAHRPGFLATSTTDGYFEFSAEL
jgi:hypothetical protein